MWHIVGGNEMNYIDEQTKFKVNYYALYISIVTRKNASESLRSMGLTEGRNINAIKNRAN